VARNSEGFDPDVKLPPELKVAHVRKAIEYIERKRQNSFMKGARLEKAKAAGRTLSG